MDAHMGEWRVPGYTEVRELGVGGSGRVVLARYDVDDTPVAIKYLSDELRADPGFVVRFRHEARLLELVDNPHCARFYEYVESDGGAAIVMELVDGVSLRAMLRSEGPTGGEAALTLLKGSLLGLAAAHAGGVVHRDFKPENIMIEASGQSKLLDFGIAVRPGDGVSGAGTPPYMAPEQWAGAPAAPSTDVYAATIVFFECLTGTRPFQSRNVAALARQHQSMPPPVEQVPAPLRGLVERGLAKHPANRPPTADAFLVELEAVAAEAYGPDWEERGRRRLAGLAALLGLLFPLGGEAPDASTSLAETDLGVTGGAARKLGVKIVAGVAGLAVIAAVTAVLVGSLGDPELQAQESPVTPTPAVTETTLDPSAEPGIDETPLGEPSEEPSEAPSTPVPASSAAAPPTGAAPTQAAPPKPTPSKKPARTPVASGTAGPTPKKSETPKDDPSNPDVNNDLPSGKPKPKPSTPSPPPPPTTQAPSPTRTRTPPASPTPNDSPDETPRGSSDTSTDQSSPPPRDGSDGPGESGGPDGTPVPGPSGPGGGLGLLAAGLVTTGAVPATLVLRKRMAGRHRRR
ncbi:serine/threonine-protein kinase [Sphaerisporangium sp. B11E5]|uniref:serine/threonine-protein kinase n=1 Tax=Sphaerisporangium sp. B11E5 TaxID=3153563 RepID=UPI00325EB7DD